MLLNITNTQIPAKLNDKDISILTLLPGKHLKVWYYTTWMRTWGKGVHMHCKEKSELFDLLRAYLTLSGKVAYV